MVKRRIKRYTVEFKEEAVRFAKESGLSLTKAAAELKVPATTLSQWLDIAGVREPTETVTVAPMTEHDELIRLRREVEQLRQERDFLKKAAAFFAKDGR